MCQKFNGKWKINFAKNLLVGCGGAMAFLYCAASLAMHAKKITKQQRNNEQ